MGLTRDQIRKRLEGELYLCQYVLLVAYDDARIELRKGICKDAIKWFNSDDESPFSFVHIITCLYGTDASVKKYRKSMLANARRGQKISMPRVKRRTT